MAVNLVTKHGLMPKKCFPESFSSDSSGRLNGILKSKLREYAKNLRKLVSKYNDKTDTGRKSKETSQAKGFRYVR